MYGRTPVITWGYDDSYRAIDLTKRLGVSDKPNDLKAEATPHRSDTSSTDKLFNISWSISQLTPFGDFAYQSTI